VGRVEGTSACGEGLAPDLEATETGGVPGVPGAEHAAAFDRCRKAFTATLIGQVLVRLVALALVLVAHVSPCPRAEAAGAASAPRSRCAPAHGGHRAWCSAPCRAV